MANILFEFDIDAPVNAVYQVLTQAEGIKGWWTVDNDLKPEIGSRATFGFGPGSLVFDVTTLRENEQITWQEVETMPGWEGTKVTFDLESTDTGTKLHFGHRDFASDDGSFASTSWNWAFFLFSLKSYVETGQGTPVGGPA